MRRARAKACCRSDRHGADTLDRLPPPRSPDPLLCRSPNRARKQAWPLGSHIRQVEALGFELDGHRRIEEAPWQSHQRRESWPTEPKPRGFLCSYRRRQELAVPSRRTPETRVNRSWFPPRILQRSRRILVRFSRVLTTLALGIVTKQWEVVCSARNCTSAACRSTPLEPAPHRAQTWGHGGPTAFGGVGGRGLGPGPGRAVWTGRWLLRPAAGCRDPSDSAKNPVDPASLPEYFPGAQLRPHCYAVFRRCGAVRWP